MGEDCSQLFEVVEGREVLTTTTTTTTTTTPIDDVIGVEVDQVNRVRRVEVEEERDGIAVCDGGVGGGEEGGSGTGMTVQVHLGGGGEGRRRREKGGGRSKEEEGGFSRNDMILNPPQPGPAPLSLFLPPHYFIDYEIHLIFP